MISRLEEKIWKDYEEAKVLSDLWKDQGYEVVFTNGCFDIIHRGHLDYLIEARSLGDKLIVGLNSDESVKRIKGKDRPISNMEDRALLLASLLYVDAVVIFEEDTPQSIIEFVVPDVLVKGGDYKKEEIVGGSYVIANGGEVKVLSFTEGYSSSGIIEKIKSI